MAERTPPWRTLISYLSDRSMYLTYNGEQSSQKMIPRGGPQGVSLGGLIFIIKYKGAFLRLPVSRPMTMALSESKHVAVSINQKNCLVPDPVDRARPRHEKK